MNPPMPPDMSERGPAACGPRFATTTTSPAQGGRYGDDRT